jgi:hypothetical protein
MSGVILANFIISAIGITIALMALFAIPHWFQRNFTSLETRLILILAVALIVVAEYYISPLFAEVRVAGSEEDLYYPLGDADAASNNRWRGP